MGKKEKKDRKRNIVVKGVKIMGGKKKEAVEKIMKDIETEIKIEEIRRLRGNEEKETKMIWVRLGNKEQRKEVMEKKKRLRGKKERIIEDLTWKERKMR